MKREFIINYEKLDDFINQWQKNPNRTDWELTMFRNNLKNIKQDSNKLKMMINESDWEIEINWQANLEFRTIPTWYSINKKTKLYHQVKEAIKEAKHFWIYDKIFNEIKKQENKKI